MTSQGCDVGQCCDVIQPQKGGKNQITEIWLKIGLQFLSVTLSKCFDFPLFFYHSLYSRCWWIGVNFFSDICSPLLPLRHLQSEPSPAKKIHSSENFPATLWPPPAFRTYLLLSCFLPAFYYTFTSLLTLWPPFSIHIHSPSSLPKLLSLHHQ